MAPGRGWGEPAGVFEAWPSPQEAPSGKNMTYFHTDLLPAYGLGENSNHKPLSKESHMLSFDYSHELAPSSQQTVRLRPGFKALFSNSLNN